MNDTTFAAKVGMLALGRDTRRWGAALYRVPTPWVGIRVNRDWPNVEFALGRFMLTLGRLTRLLPGHTPDPRTCPICKGIPR